MKKPHEQEWKQGDAHDYMIQVGDVLEVHVKAAFWRHPDGDAGATRDADALFAFLKAAPDMARALLDVWSGTLFHRDGPDIVVRVPLERWEAIGAALKKAGIVPYSP